MRPYEGQSDAAYATDFLACFAAISFMPVQAEPNLQISRVAFFDRAREIINAALGSLRGEITARPFFAAGLAHGLAYTIASEKFPNDAYLALANHGGTFLDGSGWRAILDGAALKTATALPSVYREHRIMMGAPGADRSIPQPTLWQHGKQVPDFYG